MPTLTSPGSGTSSDGEARGGQIWHGSSVQPLHIHHRVHPSGGEGRTWLPRTAKEGEIGEYCAAKAAAAAEVEQPVAVAVPPLPLAARCLYGDCDRCSTKHVFDNLHGNMYLDPFSLNV